MATIIIPTALRQYAGQKSEVSIPGSTIDEVLGTLTENYPELRKQLYSESGKLRNFVNVYVNEEDVRYLQKGSTPISGEDTISIIPAIAGGAVQVDARPGVPLASSGETGEGVTLSHEEIRRYS